MTSANGVPVVIDNGSFTMKVGFAGEDKPRDVFRTAIVTNNQEKTTHPIVRGDITDWEGMEEIWRQVFHDKLHIASEDHPVLMTERPYNPRVFKERMYEIMFETFKVPSLHIAMQGVLSMYASGRTTGLVLDSGHGLTQFVPIHDGIPIHDAVLIDTDLAGVDVTWYLEKMMRERGIKIDVDNARDNDIAKQDLIRDIKEKLCYVCTDDVFTHSKLAPKDLEKTYHLPDGTAITLDRERAQCPEALFKSALIGTDAFGISESCCNAIDRCSNRDLHPLLYKNILLAGGNTLFNGFQERLRGDLVEFAPLAIQEVGVHGIDDRAHAAWRGGAIWGASSSFRDSVITKEDFEEKGAK